MKSIKNLKKLFGILFGALGLGSMFSSCSKEVTCVCSYQYGMVNLDLMEMTIEGDCSEVSPVFSFPTFDTSYVDVPENITLNCREK